MGIKKYFTGRTGLKFWLNILAMIVVLIGVPLGFFSLLGPYTHHGEKIKVPYVVGMSAYDAQMTLENAGLQGVVNDSDFMQGLPPGVILEQSPDTLAEVKSGRVISLKINLNGERLVKLPDLSGNSSLRQARAQLEAMGFKLAPDKIIDGYPKDLVVGIRQGTKELHSGEMVSKDRALTIMVGGGEMNDTLPYNDFDETFGYEDDDMTTSSSHRSSPSYGLPGVSGGQSADTDSEEGHQAGGEAPAPAGNNDVDEESIDL